MSEERFLYRTGVIRGQFLRQGHASCKNEVAGQVIIYYSRSMAAWVNKILSPQKEIKDPRGREGNEKGQEKGKDKEKKRGKKKGEIREGENERKTGKGNSRKKGKGGEGEVREGEWMEVDSQGWRQVGTWRYLGKRKSRNGEGWGGKGKIERERGIQEREGKQMGKVRGRWGNRERERREGVGNRWKVGK